MSKPTRPEAFEVELGAEVYERIEADRYMDLLEAENARLRDEWADAFDKGITAADEAYMERMDALEDEVAELQALRDHDHCLLTKLEAENVELPDKSLVSRAIEADLRANLTRAVELLRVEPLNEIARRKHRKIVAAFLSEMKGEPMNPSGNSTLSVPDDAYVPGD